MPGQAAKIFPGVIKRLIGITFFISLFVNLLYLVVPIYMLQSFDRVLPTESVDTLLFLCAAAILGLTIQLFLYIIRSRILVRLSVLFDLKVSTQALRSSLAIARLARRPVPNGGLNHITTIRNFISGDGIFALFDAPWVPVYIIVIYLFHPWLGHVAVVGVLILLVMALLNERLTREPLSTASAANAQSYAQANTAIGNAPVVEAMGMREAILDRWSARNAEALYHASKASDRAGVLSGLSRVLRLMIQIGLLTMGIYLAVKHELTPGAAIAAVILIGRGLAPVEQAIGTWKQFIAARNSYGQLKKILDAVPAPPDSVALPVPRGQLSVENVFYAPPGSQRPILSRVAFRLEPGEGLGVIGPSAAGKTTLTELMVGVHPPSSGKIRLDGADLITWDKEQVGRYIGYIPQDVELFDGTIAENISRFQPDADSADIVEAAELASVHDMILRLPEGYETQIGPRGTNLSAGQRQRIALARALYRNPVLLVLDEPNSNLDNEGEQALLRALQVAKKRGATVVMVTHRPSTLEFADKLLVLQNGMVQDFGPRAEVLQKLAPVRLQPRQAAAQEQQQSKA